LPKIAESKPQEAKKRIDKFVAKKQTTPIGAWLQRRSLTARHTLPLWGSCQQS